MQRLTASMHEMLAIGVFCSKWMNCDGKQHPSTNPNHVYWGRPERLSRLSVWIVYLFGQRMKHDRLIPLVIWVEWSVWIWQFGRRESLHRTRAWWWVRSVVPSNINLRRVHVIGLLDWQCFLRILFWARDDCSSIVWSIYGHPYRSTFLIAAPF